MEIMKTNFSSGTKVTVLLLNNKVYFTVLQDKVGCEDYLGFRRDKNIKNIKFPRENGMFFYVNLTICQEDSRICLTRINVTSNNILS